MKLASAESKAILFVLFVIALAVFARFLNRPSPIQLEQSIVPGGAIADRSASKPARAPRSTRPLDPNTASAAELNALPGIGDATAQKIIAQRPYRTLNDLARVIGNKRARSLARRLTLPEATASAEPDEPSETPRATLNTRAAAGLAARPRVINLNRADQAELETLPGIGPSLARRLIAARDSLRGFRNWSQVDSVSGVGPALLKKLKLAATL